MKKRNKPKKVQGEKSEGPLPSGDQCDGFVARIYRQEEEKRKRLEQARAEEEKKKSDMLPKVVKMTEAQREVFRQKRLQHEAERKAKLEAAKVTEEPVMKKMTDEQIEAFRVKLLTDEDARKERIEALRKQKEDRSVKQTPAMKMTPEQLEASLQRQMAQEQARLEKLELLQKSKVDKEQFQLKPSLKLTQEQIAAKAEEMMKQEEGRRQRLEEARKAKEEAEIAMHGTKKISKEEMLKRTQHLYDQAMESMSKQEEERQRIHAEEINRTKNGRRMDDAEIASSGSKLAQNVKPATPKVTAENSEGKPRGGNPIG